MFQACRRDCTSRAVTLYCRPSSMPGERAHPMTRRTTNVIRGDDSHGFRSFLVSGIIPHSAVQPLSSTGHPKKLLSSIAELDVGAPVGGRMLSGSPSSAARAIAIGAASLSTNDGEAQLSAISALQAARQRLTARQPCIHTHPKRACSSLWPARAGDVVLATSHDGSSPRVF